MMKLEELLETMSFRMEPWHGPEGKQRIVFQEDVFILREFYVADKTVTTYNSPEPITVETPFFEDKILFILETIEKQGLKVNKDFLTGWLIGCLGMPKAQEHLFVDPKGKVK